MGRREKWQSVAFTVVMGLLLVAVAASAWIRGQNIKRISYADHMEDVAVTVDGIDYKVKDLAFYLAYQEITVEKQAKVYDIEDTSKYWNLHTNGFFIRDKAKDYAMDMAVHDIIFCQMAEEEGIELTEEEWKFMENQKMDFWNDLEEEGRKRLGISEEEISETFKDMALAQKMQQFLAEVEEAEYRQYDADGDLYGDLLKTHTYEINEKLWKRLKFGKIILD